MTKFIKYILLLLCTVVVFQSTAQVNYQSEYLSGKNYFRQGNYQMAKNKFEKVLDREDDNPFYLYASYFYAISSYQINEEENALEQLRRIRITHPKWDKLDEVNVWYGHMLLDQSDLFKGLEVLNEVKSPGLIKIAVEVKKSHLKNYDSIPLLQKAFELNSYDKVLAKRLADVINRKPVLDRPIELLEFLIDSFELNKADYDFVDKATSQMKATYNVAVLLPFMVDNLTTSQGSKANQFVLDLYEGIRLAADQHNSRGTKIKLFPYDTKKDSIATTEIINSGELLEMDLIIGPLYPIPVKLLKEYSLVNRINMVNPLSTNSSIIGTNPYSFLLKSTPETRAKKAASYAKENFTNKKATIFYGSSSQDSIFAHSYKQFLEADSFEITWITPVRSAIASTEILRVLTSVKGRTGSDGEVQAKRSVKVRVNEDESLFLSKDSIGHILVASTDNILISNILSAVDTRRDGISIIGLEDWLEIEQISFEQLERMGVIMIGQNYFEFGSEEVAIFKEAYLNNYNRLPTQFSYDGFETMMVFGSKLINYGNYFQYGIYHEGLQDGELFYGFDYTNANDNQFVPVMRLEDLNLIMLNVKNTDQEKSKLD
jgi:tetratricopeptide (TPR) repeat protein